MVDIRETPAPGGGAGSRSLDRGSLGSIAPDSPLYIILNAGSGRDDPAEVRKIIEPVFEAAGHPYAVRLVEDPGRLLQTVAETVDTALASGGVVVAAGGDGAVNAVVQAAWPRRCPMGVLPQGTFNYFARSHGIPEDPAAAARLLLEGEMRPVQLGLANDRVFLVNASLGLYPELLEARENFQRRFGRSRPAALLAGAFTLLRRHRVLRLTLETRAAVESRWTPTLFVGNNALQLEQIGLAGQGGPETGELVAVMLQPVGKPALLGLMVRGALGNLGEAPSVVSFPFRSLRVRHSAFAGRRIKVALDGEILWLRTPLEFRVAPTPLFLIKKPG